MKILFVADHHIKIGQKGVPEEWARNRFDMLWYKMHDLATHHKVDVVMHGGDIFDRVPSPAETGIMLDMFKIMSGNYTHVVYPGNHESTSKYKSFWEEFSALESDKVIMFHEFSQLEDGIHILPYTDLKKKHWHGTKGRLLFTHVRGEIPPHVNPEIDLSLFDTWDLVLAGDLHAHSNSQRNIVYPGSPITTSFHRKESSGENGVIIIDTSDLSYTHVDLKLPQLLRRTVDNPDDMVRSDYHHTIYELMGNATSLATVKGSDLLDKKIIERNTEATLNLTETTMEEELSIYLKEVECLDTQAVKGLVDEYVDIVRTGDN